MELRYDLLLFIKANQPVGRRNLASELSLSERQVRNEIEFLQIQNFVEVERQGIHLTERGEEILVRLKEVIYSYKNLEDLVEKVKSKLSIKKVFIIPGDSQKNHIILEFMGQSAGNYISKIVKHNSVMAITGGSSVAAVARNIPEMNVPSVTVLPARGGIGKSHSTQANSIVATLADRLHAQPEMLHLPDNIDKEILDVLKESPEIKEVFDKYHDIDILVFGIGRADVMAKWRHLPQEKVNKLMNEKAVAETFGHFFNSEGDIVCPSSSVGISLEEYLRIPNIVAIAGGKDKSQAIQATCKIRNDLVLFTDECAAMEILKN
nr:sugar-binding domain-containing protein [Alkalibaculum sporogenes]